MLEDGALVVVGTGAPCAAAMLAQKTTAPRLTLMFESGGIGPNLPRMPISVGDSRTFYRGLMATGMLDVMETCQRGLVDYCFLGGAQIDQFGNLNSTLIGDDYRQAPPGASARQRRRERPGLAGVAHAGDHAA
jgi:glutaconate CoA-transferase subunit B